MKTIEKVGIELNKKHIISEKASLLGGEMTHAVDLLRKNGASNNDLDNMRLADYDGEDNKDALEEALNKHLAQKIAFDNWQEWYHLDKKQQKDGDQLRQKAANIAINYNSTSLDLLIKKLNDEEDGEIRKTKADEINEILLYSRTALGIDRDQAQFAIIAESLLVAAAKDPATMTMVIENYIINAPVEQLSEYLQQEQNSKKLFDFAEKSTSPELLATLTNHPSTANLAFEKGRSLEILSILAKAGDGKLAAYFAQLDDVAMARLIQESLVDKEKMQQLADVVATMAEEAISCFFGRIADLLEKTLIPKSVMSLLKNLTEMIKIAIGGKEKENKKITKDEQALLFAKKKVRVKIGRRSRVTKEIDLPISVEGMRAAACSLYTSTEHKLNMLEHYIAHDSAMACRFVAMMVGFGNYNHLAVSGVMLNFVKEHEAEILGNMSGNKAQAEAKLHNSFSEVVIEKTAAEQDFEITENPHHESHLQRILHKKEHVEEAHHDDNDAAKTQLLEWEKAKNTMADDLVIKKSGEQVLNKAERAAYIELKARKLSTTPIEELSKQDQRCLNSFVEMGFHPSRSIEKLMSIEALHNSHQMSQSQ